VRWGALDDFECTGSGGLFGCQGSAFTCTTSFDDEDCEPQYGFTCSKKEFTCSGNDYN
jgi:hypothetical protein